MVRLAEPFDLDGDDDVGVVLLHGFTGTPFEIGFLGRALAAAGHSVTAPLLPGHATSLDDLDRTRWEDWVAAVDAAIARHAARCRRVAIVGQSLGGLLSLYAAARHPAICAVASLAAPLWLDGLGRHAARLTAPGAPLARVRRLPKLGGSDVRDAEAKAANPCYPAIPTRALAQLTAFMRVVDAALPSITQPTLVIHATQDHTAPVASAYRIAARVPHVTHVRILPRSYHLIAVDVERELVAADVIRFLHQVKDPACAT